MQRSAGIECIDFKKAVNRWTERWKDRKMKDILQNLAAMHRYKNTKMTCAE